MGGEEEGARVGAAGGAAPPQRPATGQPDEAEARSPAAEDLPAKMGEVLEARAVPAGRPEGASAGGGAGVEGSRGAEGAGAGEVAVARADAAVEAAHTSPAAEAEAGGGTPGSARGHRRAATLPRKGKGKEKEKAAAVARAEAPEAPGAGNSSSSAEGRDWAEPLLQPETGAGAEEEKTTGGVDGMENMGLTEEDCGSIGALTAMGFGLSKAAVARAYLACNKDAELTANFLVEQRGASAADDRGEANSAAPRRRSSKLGLGRLVARLDASLDGLDRRIFHDRGVMVREQGPEEAAHSPPQAREGQEPQAEPEPRREADAAVRPRWRAVGRGLARFGRWAREGLEAARGEADAMRRDFAASTLAGNERGLHPEQVRALAHGLRAQLDAEGVGLDCPAAWWLRAHGYDVAAAADAAIAADAWRAARRGRANPHAAGNEALAAALADGRVRWQGHDTRERPILCIRAAMVDEGAGAASADFMAILHTVEAALAQAAPDTRRERVQEEAALAVLRAAGDATDSHALARAAGIAMATRSANGSFTLLYDSSGRAPTSTTTLRLILTFVDALMRFYPGRLAMLIAMPKSAEASKAMPLVVPEISSVAAAPDGADLVLAPASAAEARAFVPLHSLPARLGGQQASGASVDAGAKQAECQPAKSPATASASASAAAMHDAAGSLEEFSQMLQSASQVDVAAFSLDDDTHDI